MVVRKKSKSRAVVPVLESTTRRVLINKAGNLDDVEYQNLRDQFQAWGRGQVKKAPLFTTDADPETLWNIYLGSMPEAERQHHTCTACRRFIMHYGHLVTMAENGKTTPVFWPGAADWELGYDEAFARLHDIVAKAKVTGVFYSDDTDWGSPVTGVWMHLAYVWPVGHPLARQKRGSLTARQEMAVKREDYATVNRALVEFPPLLLEQAVALVSSQAAYRGERVLGPTKWLHDVQHARMNAPAKMRANIVWRAVALAPEGFCHTKSSVVGSLLEDLSTGMASTAALERFNAKMAPSVYQRATEAPSAGTIQQAERLFATMGLAPSLPRRVATIQDIPAEAVIWMPKVVKSKKGTGAVFGHLTPRDAPDTTPLELPTVTMTWAKFVRDVLPSAHTVEARVPAAADRFVALVTAENPEAPPLLQWDRPEARNPVSWYYASGVDAEIRRRVTLAGGQHSDVDIRASLMWNSYTDLDLHVQGPDGYIWYGDRGPTRSGGWLDVDANAGGGSPSGRGTRTPIENTRWGRGRAPAGSYRVWVRHYCNGSDPARTPFQAELEIAGEVISFVGETSRAGQEVELARFTYIPGRPVQRQSAWTVAPASTPDQWALTAGAFVPVRAFIPSPNLWGPTPSPQHGRHVFAILEGCRDVQQGVGRGFFTETLRSDLRPVRSVLEAYAADAIIATEGRVPLAGLGFSDQGPWNLVLRVTTPASTAHYTIDRAE